MQVEWLQDEALEVDDVQVLWSFQSGCADKQRLCRIVLVQHNNFLPMSKLIPVMIVIPTFIVSILASVVITPIAPINKKTKQNKKSIEPEA